MPMPSKQHTHVSVKYPHYLYSAAAGALVKGQNQLIFHFQHFDSFLIIWSAATAIKHGWFCKDWRSLLLWKIVQIGLIFGFAPQPAQGGEIQRQCICQTDCIQANIIFAAVSDTLHWQIVKYFHAMHPKLGWSLGNENWMFWMHLQNEWGCFLDAL